MAHAGSEYSKGSSTLPDTKQLPRYTAAEVRQHDTLESLWVIFEKLVYDITEFQEDHPGGGELLIEHAGMCLSCQPHSSTNVPSLIS